MTDDVEGGPGLSIRGSDLRPAITDLAVFRIGTAGDRLAPALELLWTGRPTEALALLDAEPRSTRVAALRADCLRDLGELDAAQRIHDALVARHRGTPHEAVLRQHGGKVRLAAGDLPGAVDDLERALALRGDAGPLLRSSTVQALSAARKRLHQIDPVGGSDL